MDGNELKRYLEILKHVDFDNLAHPINSWEKLKRMILSSPRNKYLTRFFRYFSRFKRPKKWVFIVGCYNSGTTLLERILAEHPSISALDEGVFLTDQLNAPEEFGWARMWHKVKNEIELRADDESVDIEELKRDWSIFLDPNKDVYLEKSISNSVRVRWLQNNFKNSHFIFLVRNGYAVSEGIRRKAGKGKSKIPKEYGKEYPIKLCAEQWVKSNRILEDEGKEIDKFLEIKYEDLCDDTEEIVKGILAFIGLEGEIAIANNKDWRVQEKKQPIENMNKRSFDNLSKKDINKINQVAGEMLEFYGYDLM